ncbi:DnaJ domain-containing protein [Deltaproteobacteria bacterium TL4]
MSFISFKFNSAWLFECFLFCHFILFSWPLCAKQTSEYIQQTHSFKVPYAVEGLAISADEALIAVAMNAGDSHRIVEIYDRRSMKPVAQIVFQDRPVTAMAFNPHQRQLALANDAVIQLWDLTQMPTQGDLPLSEENLLWQQKLQQATPLKFSWKSPHLRWIDNKELRELLLKPPFSSTSSQWKDKQSSVPLLNFSFNPTEQLLALIYKDERQIELIDLMTQKKRNPLDYHLFPVVDLHFVDPQTLLSLDEEQNLVWGHVMTRVKVNGPRVEGLDPNEKTLLIYPVYHDRYLLLVSQSLSEKQYYASVIDKNGKQHKKIILSSPKGVAISPTGTYILTSSDQTSVDLHTTRIAQNPSEYIRQLNQMGAHETARLYRNHLEILPTSLKNGEAYDEDNTSLRLLIDRLHTAEALEQWQDLKQIVKELLKLAPKHPEGLRIQELLRANEDLILLEQAQDALEAKNPERAIRLLVQISKTGKHHSEARQLIEIAEQHKKMASQLENARQTIKQKNWAGTEILLDRILQQDPSNDEAQTLLDEVHKNLWIDRILEFIVNLLWLFVLALLGLLGFHYRKKIMSWLTMEEDTSTPNLKPPLRSRVKSQQKREPASGEKYFFETLTKAEELIRLAREADVHKLHTSRLLDFAAEIKVIQRNANDDEVDYKHLTSQLLVLIQTVRNLNFKASQNKSEKAKPDQEQSKQQDQQSRQQSYQEPTPPKSALPDYYQILELSPQATAEDIKKAYHQKIKEYHPDRHQSSDFEWVKEQAEQMTRLLHEAYEVLSNPVSRRSYDRKH